MNEALVGWLVVAVILFLALRRKPVAVTPTGGITAPEAPAAKAPAGPVAGVAAVVSVVNAHRLVAGEVKAVDGDPNDIKYIMISKAADGVPVTVQLGEVYVYGADGKALGRDDFASVKFVDGTMAEMDAGANAKNAVDGDTATWTKSTTAGRVMLQLELAKPQLVQSLVVFNRADCCQQELAGTIVYLVDSKLHGVYGATLTADMQQKVVLG